MNASPLLADNPDLQQKLLRSAAVLRDIGGSKEVAMRIFGSNGILASPIFPNPEVFFDTLGDTDWKRVLDTTHNEAVVKGLRQIFSGQLIVGNENQIKHAHFVLERLQSLSKLPGNFEMLAVEAKMVDVVDALGHRIAGRRYDLVYRLDDVTHRVETKTYGVLWTGWDPERADFALGQYLAKGGQGEADIVRNMLGSSSDVVHLDFPKSWKSSLGGDAEVLVLKRLGDRLAALPEAQARALARQIGRTPDKAKPFRQWWTETVMTNQDSILSKLASQKYVRIAE